MTFQRIINMSDLINSIVNDLKSKIQIVNITLNRYFSLLRVNDSISSSRAKILTSVQENQLIEMELAYLFMDVILNKKKQLAEALDADKENLDEFSNDDDDEEDNSL